MRYLKIIDKRLQWRIFKFYEGNALAHKCHEIVNLNQRKRLEQETKLLTSLDFSNSV